MPPNAETVDGSGSEIPPSEPFESASHKAEEPESIAQQAEEQRVNKLPEVTTLAPATSTAEPEGNQPQIKSSKTTQLQFKFPF